MQPESDDANTFDQEEPRVELTHRVLGDRARSVARKSTWEGCLNERVPTYCCREMTGSSWRLRAPSILLALARHWRADNVLRQHKRRGPRGEDAAPDRIVEKESPGDELNINIDPRRLGSSWSAVEIVFQRQ